MWYGWQAARKKPGDKKAKVIMEKSYQENMIQNPRPTGKIWTPNLEGRKESHLREPGGVRRVRGDEAEQNSKRGQRCRVRKIERRLGLQKARGKSRVEISQKDHWREKGAKGNYPR